VSAKTPLSSTPTHSYTFSEFALICSCLLSPGQLRPVDVVREATGNLYRRVLTEWSTIVVRDNMMGFGAGIRRDLWIESQAVGSDGGTGAGSFKGESVGDEHNGNSDIAVCGYPLRDWKDVMVTLDGGGPPDGLPEGEGSGYSDHQSTTAVSAPFSPSPTLVNLLAVSWFRLTRDMVSVDTLQVPLPLPALPSIDRDLSHTTGAGDCVPSQSLATQAMDALYSCLGIAVASEYSSLHPSSPTIRSSSWGAAEGTEVWAEKRALQALLDLRLLENLLVSRVGSGHDLGAVQLSESIRSARDLWQDRADAVDLQLLSDHMTSAVDTFIERNKHVLPCPRHLDSTTGPKSRRGAVAVTSDEGSLLAVHSSPRFSLLPLPFLTASTTTSSGKMGEGYAVLDTLRSPSQGSDTSRVTSSGQKSQSLSLGLGLAQGTAIGKGVVSSLEGLRSNLSGLNSFGLASFLQQQPSQQSSSS